jgi:BirA family biotin operon repressor/biotin-[acetyl-CoA-carboxylase] ligase
VDGKKVAGILVEAESTGSRIDFLVAGIGINVNGHAKQFPAALVQQAITLEDVLGCDSCIPDVEALLVRSIDKWLGKLKDGEASQVVAAFRARDALKGKRVRTPELEGTAEGVDDAGRLLVRTKNKLETVQAGTVTLA